ncbi:MAG: heme-copper oxidase subunit III [Cyanobacteria bacterium M_surface_7_m2_040]|nr:heme-copper oxidase subunit III [Cyanobacteria bacterium K_Offshore_0m_m2_072]MBM5808948.1 heme-copper oxidase subunit III [Cyanobacteria bacterium M_surface_9_m1_291]MBM5827169.1 heme-copper oxidase subunit III [Cyanobacteria bacterium M_surface_7_m2_040]
MDTSLRSRSDADDAAALQQEQAASHEEHGDHRLFGLTTFLVADGMTFAGFFAAYLTFKAVNPLPPGSTYELELVLPTINTVLLLVSSFTFHRAGSQCRAGQMASSRLWLLLTTALGAAFLAGQMVEYFTLPFGLRDNLFASTFYALTGFHGLHVTLGVICILIVWWQARSGGRITPSQHFGLEAAELYWHFVDGIWVVLYGILYLL